MKNKGISLIVLIITIVVIIILSTTILVNIANTNIIRNVNEAVLKQDFATLNDELELYVADMYTETLGKFEVEKLNADATSVIYTGKGSIVENNIYDILSSLKNSKYKEAVEIQNGEIVLNYTNLSDELKEIAINNDLKLKSISISTAGELAKIGVDENYPLFCSYELTGNIDLSSVCSESLGSWIPIGTYDNMFSGVFNGNGYTISNLYINTDTNNFQGLFTGNRGSIKNIVFENANVKGRYGVGIVVGENKSGNIENISINNGNLVGYQMIGSICGKNAGGKISLCKNNATVSYFKFDDTENNNLYGWRTGGITGHIENGTIEKCINYGNVTGTHNTGGITGSGSGVISLCVNSGDITCEYTETTSGNAGGIIGYASGADKLDLTIENSYNVGTIKDGEDTSYSNIGGITGVAGGYDCEIKFKNCYSIGTIIPNDNTYRFGGFIGAATMTTTKVDLENCYYTANCGIDVDTVPDVIKEKLLLIDEDMNVFFNNLGSNYVEDKNNINNGYPILNWQI